MIHDQINEQQFVPLNNLGSSQARFVVCNSSLSEFGILGFELGYSLVSPDALSVWEHSLVTLRIMLSVLSISLFLQVRGGGYSALDWWFRSLMGMMDRARSIRVGGLSGSCNYVTIIRITSLLRRRLRGSIKIVTCRLFTQRKLFIAFLLFMLFVLMISCYTF